MGERTPIRVVFERYSSDMTTSEKDHVNLDEFSKRLKRIYEIKNVRHDDGFNQCMRLMSYMIK